MAERERPDYSAGKWAHAFRPRAKGEVRYWLLKSEPETFSWDDLLASPGRTTHWDGVRNFAARNFLLDGMAVGDEAFFYHSMTGAQAIVGIVVVVRAGYPDHTAFDRKHHGYDPDSKADAPQWYMVDVRAVAPLARPVALTELKASQALARMALLRIGRLSVTPVTAAEWKAVIAMSERPPASSRRATSPKRRGAR
ncbi:MAG: EVE domain-containing protein [Gemmatimonadetes bacterium]|nr:EVE domain-containing protein [Gemmatimonadota bacterium]